MVKSVYWKSFEGSTVLTRRLTRAYANASDGSFGFVRPRRFFFLGGGGGSKGRQRVFFGGLGWGDGRRFYMVGYTRYPFFFWGCDFKKAGIFDKDSVLLLENSQYISWSFCVGVDFSSVLQDH